MNQHKRDAVHGIKGHIIAFADAFCSIGLRSDIVKFAVKLK